MSVIDCTYDLNEISGDSDNEGLLNSGPRGQLGGIGCFRRHTASISVAAKLSRGGLLSDNRGMTAILIFQPTLSTNPKHSVHSNVLLDFAVYQRGEGCH